LGDDDRQRPAAWDDEKKADALAKVEADKSPDGVGIPKPTSTNWGNRAL